MPSEGQGPSLPGLPCEVCLVNQCIAHAALALPLAVLGLRLQWLWLLVAASRSFAGTTLCPSPCAEPREPQYKVTVPQRSPAQADIGCLCLAPSCRACCTLNVNVCCLCSLWEQHLCPELGIWPSLGLDVDCIFFLSLVKSCSCLY